MALGRLVEGGGDDLSIDGAGHVRDLLRALVDEQHHQVGFGMVGGNGIGHVLHEHGLTSLGLGDDQRALTLANRSEEIDDTRAQIGGGAVATEHVFLIGEERREMLERHAVAHLGGHTPVDLVDARQREVFLAIVGRAHMTLHHVARLETKVLDLLDGDIDIVGGRKIIVIGRAKESIAVGHHLKNAISLHQIGKIKLFHTCLCGSGGHGLEGSWSSSRWLRRRTIKDIECGERALVFYRQVLDDDEIRAVSRIACPDTVFGHAWVFLGRILAVVDLGLELGQKIIVILVRGRVVFFRCRLDLALACCRLLLDEVGYFHCHWAGLLGRLLRLVLEIRFVVGLLGGALLASLDVSLCTRDGFLLGL